MKESITKFDLDAAFKALDEIEIPTAKKVRANRPALTEIFSRKTKFDALMEEYYDVSSTAELGDAQEAREAEVAKAKLARIEKIVDLDAESPEDLLTSYVGKFIMQCPQCMTLFYKNPEDIVEAEDDPDTVNVNEVCQHCGNESGYTLVGKVGEATPEEVDSGNFDLDAAAELSTETEVEEPVEEETTEEEPAEGRAEDLGDLEALDLDLDLEDEEEEKKEESFVTHVGEPLVEEFSDDSDLDAKLEAHNEYIEYLRAAIAQEEEKLEKATNEQVKVAIQRNIDAYKVDLEGALPDAVKNDIALPEESSTDEEPTEVESKTTEETEVQEESYVTTTDAKTLTEGLHEEADVDVSAEEFKALISSPEFKKPISDAEVRAMLSAEKQSEDKSGVDESVDAEQLDEGIFDKIKSKITAVTDKLKTPAAKAEWILKNAMIDYDKAVLTDNGDLEAQKENRRFTTFIVIGYTNKDKSGNPVDFAIHNVESSIKNLVSGMKHPEVTDKYANAAKIAEGWSMKPNNGPAIIYLAKNAQGEGAAFLIQYHKGKAMTGWHYDKMDTYIEEIRAEIAGSKKMAQGGANQTDFKKIPANQLKKDMQVQLGNKTMAEVLEVVQSELDTQKFDVTLRYLDQDKTKTFCVEPTYEFNVLRSTEKTEGLDTFMADLEELQESSLETRISDSLVEAYGNVAGFKITECAYRNNKLNVDGIIYFTSGNTRKTTYAFDKAFLTEGKICLQGLNAKLGLDKQFTITGYADDKKTFITESFTYIKK